MVEESKKHFDSGEERAVTEGSRLPSRIVYEIVRRDGIEELERPNASLVWSGLAAGLTISFSVLAEAMFRIHLPDADWRPLIENFGYSLGFLLTILGRLQLFTENTITTVIPLLDRPRVSNLLATLRLWSIVFAANTVGTIIAALFIAYSGAFDEEMLAAVGELSVHMMENDVYAMFVKAVPAGILIAAVVWMLPSIGGGAFWVILIFTYLIALGEFTHVVAGSTEAGYLLVIGEIGLRDFLFGFMLPVLLGNVVGGTVVFGFLAYTQVSSEIE